MATQKNEMGTRVVRKWQLACGLLFVAFLASAAWAMYTQRNYEVYVDERLNEYPLIDPARNFIDQEDFIVNIQSLREKLIALVEERGPDSISLYFEFLNTGANISINQDLDVWPASLLKVPMAMAVMKKIEDGEWTLTNEMVLTEDDRDPEYGDLWKRPVGARLTIEELLREMLSRSDNTAYQIFVRNIDVDNLLTVLTELGIEELFNEEGLMSAKEYSRLFRALYTSSFLRRANSEQILEWLGQTEYNDFLGAGIPNEIVFAHKFGINSDYHAALDSGIVYIPNRPYLITVAIKGTGDPAEERSVKETMRAIGEMTYRYVSTK